ncbi:MAG: hypothetical protein J6Y90_03445 [Lachnospiraceae bacterium]|nr:hypothetical protein [Lachnospiraceae bacterium]
MYGIGDSDELSFDETSEAINQIIGGQASDQQYWNYVINAQPKTRKEQETTTPETKTPETKTPNTTNPSLEETTEERLSEAESTEVTEPESSAAETTGAESTEPIYQPDTSASESETEVETSGYESTPETTNDTDEQETEPTKPYEGKKRDGTVKTGDRSMTWLFISVCLISVGAATILAAVIAERRRRRDEKA